jgi:hypothetical protein
LLVIILISVARDAADLGPGEVMGDPLGQVNSKEVLSHWLSSTYWISAYTP